MDANNNSEPLSKILFDELSAAHKDGNLNFTEKRILKDLKEFETQVDPEMGISASPIPGNIYEWHANIKGFEGTPYENGVFHLQINVPKNYPNSPPTVSQLTQFANNFF